MWRRDRNKRFHQNIQAVTSAWGSYVSEQCLPAGWQTNHACTYVRGRDGTETPQLKQKSFYSDEHENTFTGGCTENTETRNTEHATQHVHVAKALTKRSQAGTRRSLVTVRRGTALGDWYWRMESGPGEWAPVLNGGQLRAPVVSRPRRVYDDLTQGRGPGGIFWWAVPWIPGWCKARHLPQRSCSGHGDGSKSSRPRSLVLGSR